MLLKYSEIAASPGTSITTYDCMLLKAFRVSTMIARQNLRFLRVFPLSVSASAKIGRFEIAFFASSERCSFGHSSLALAISPVHQCIGFLPLTCRGGILLANFSQASVRIWLICFVVTTLKPAVLSLVITCRATSKSIFRGFQRHLFWGLVAALTCSRCCSSARILKYVYIWSLAVSSSMTFHATILPRVPSANRVRSKKRPLFFSSKSRLPAVVCNDHAILVDYLDK